MSAKDGLPDGPIVLAIGRLGCRLCTMTFKMYANHLQHKRQMHGENGSTMRTAPVCALEVDTAMPAGLGAHARATGATLDGLHAGGTPASASAEATGMWDAGPGNGTGSQDPLSVPDTCLLAPILPLGFSVMPAAFQIPVCTESSSAVASRIARYYRAKGDMQRTALYVPAGKAGRPSDFVTTEHKAMRLFALSAGGCGLSRKAKANYYESTVAVERAAMRMVAETKARRKRRKKGKNGKGRMPELVVEHGPLESAFPSAASFVRSLDGEKWRCLSELEWRETDIVVRGTSFKFYSRCIMQVATDALTKALKICLRGERRHDAAGNIIRTNSLDSDIYLDEQVDVDRLHAGKKDGEKNMPPFTLAIQLFSDAALVSWNGCKCLSL